MVTWDDKFELCGNSSEVIKSGFDGVWGSVFRQVAAVQEYVAFGVGKELVIVCVAEDEEADFALGRLC